MENDTGFREDSQKKNRRKGEKFQRRLVEEIFDQFKRIIERAKGDDTKLFLSDYMTRGYFESHKEKLLDKGFKLSDVTDSFFTELSILDLKNILEGPKKLHADLSKLSEEAEKFRIPKTSYSDIYGSKDGGGDYKWIEYLNDIRNKYSTAHKATRIGTEFDINNVEDNTIKFINFILNQLNKKINN